MLPLPLSQPLLVQELVYHLAEAELVFLCDLSRAAIRTDDLVLMMIRSSLFTRDSSKPPKKPN